jgi:tetratricopeptide (TPR) repeat protein
VVVPGRPDVHPWEVRFDLRVDDARAPLDELGRLLALNRAYEAFDAAIEAVAVGESSAALAFFERAAELAPEDDQIRLWLSMAVFDSGDEERGRRLYRSALEVEPRAGEHLRRFLAAGQLPGQERPVARLTADE